MYVILSPSTTLDFESPAPLERYSQPRFLDAAEKLAGILRRYDQTALAEVMNLSPELAELNWKRYQAWERPFTPLNAKPALFAFTGAVYGGLQPHTLATPLFDYTQEHVAILSGLYGVLRPLDLIQPYRLELKTPLPNPAGNSLYLFWGERLTRAVCEEISRSQSDWLLNLASHEYAKALKRRLLGVPMIDVAFKEWKNGRYKTISFFAKEARGGMARYVIENQLREPSELRAFRRGGYRYSAKLSTEKKLVFTRKRAP